MRQRITYCSFEPNQSTGGSEWHQVCEDVSDITKIISDVDPYEFVLISNASYHVYLKHFIKDDKRSDEIDETKGFLLVPAFVLFTAAKFEKEKKDVEFKKQALTTVFTALAFIPVVNVCTAIEAGAAGSIATGLIDLGFDVVGIDMINNSDKYDEEFRENYAIFGLAYYFIGRGVIQKTGNSIDVKAAITKVKNKTDDLAINQGIKNKINNLYQRVINYKALNFKTVEEAEIYYKTALGAKVTDNFAHIDLDVLREVANRLSYLRNVYKHHNLEKYGCVIYQEGVIPKTTLAVSLQQRGFIFHSFANRSKIYSEWENTAQLIINGNINRVGGRFSKSLRLQIEIDHEFAHLVHWNLQVEAMTGNQAAISLMEEYLQITTKLENKGFGVISEYATAVAPANYSNKYFVNSEGFAEAFAAYINGMPNVLPLELKTFFNTKLIPYIQKK